MTGIDISEQVYDNIGVNVWKSIQGSVSYLLWSSMDTTLWNTIKDGMILGNGGSDQVLEHIYDQEWQPTDEHEW